MNNCCYKVAPRGCGKTAWLLNTAYICEVNHQKIFYFTTNEERYKEFCRKYLGVFGTASKAVLANSVEDVPQGSVVLIDDLFHIPNCAVTVEELSKKVSNAYITLEGNASVDYQENSISDDYLDNVYDQASIASYKQLSFFDDEEVI